MEAESNRDTAALVQRLRTEMPELWTRAQIVGTWVWLEFNVPPVGEVRGKLRQLGFHWNAGRKCWQHPCGPAAEPRRDPREYLPVRRAEDLALNDLAHSAERAVAKEYKVVALRECPTPERLRRCETPDAAAEYWELHVATNPYYNPECECFAVLLLNTRRRVRGHQLVSIGTLDTVMVHPREIFRVAVVACAACVVLMHNHPSGDPTPSDADIKVTRDLIRAGQLLKVEVLDHVIVAQQARCSLRELGHFYV